MNLTEKNIINFLRLTRAKARAALGIGGDGGLVENYDHWKLAGFKNGSVAPLNGEYVDVKSGYEVIFEAGNNMEAVRISENGGARQRIRFDAPTPVVYSGGVGINIFQSGGNDFIEVKMGHGITNHDPDGQGDTGFITVRPKTAGGIIVDTDGVSVDENVVLTVNSTPTLNNSWTFNAATFVRAAASNAGSVTHFPVFEGDPDAAPAKEIKSIQTEAMLAALDAHWVAKTDFSSLGTPLERKISNTIDATTFKKVYFKSSSTIQISQVPSEANDQVTLNFDAQGLFEIQSGDGIQIDGGDPRVINLKLSGANAGNAFFFDFTSGGEGGLGLKTVEFGGVEVVAGGVQADQTVVRTSGAQTIADVKTFTSFPILPSSSPTTDFQAIHKKYADDRFYNDWKVKIGTSSFTPVLRGKQVEFIAGTSMGLVKSVSDGNVTITINGPAVPVTNLSHSRIATSVTINSSTGTDTTIPLVDGTAAGFVSPTMLSNWDTAFAERRWWDGGASSLNAATGRSSLGLGDAAVETARHPSDAGAGVVRHNGTTHANGRFYSGNVNPTGTARFNYSGHLYATDFILG